MLLFSKPYVEEGEDISSAFEEAGQIIKGDSFIDKNEPGEENPADEGIVYTWVRQRLNLSYRTEEESNTIVLIYNTARLGIWTGILGVGTALALIIGQNIYQRSPQDPRSIISFQELSLIHI